MRIIGLTGGIACGKSTVSRELSRLGACIVDGDILSRQLTAPGGAALPAIHDAFGEKVFHPDGSLNRAALAAEIFGSEESRDKLDTIMQPMIRALILDGIRDAEAAGYKLCVLDMPLLFEKHLETLCDSVWCVSLPRETQIGRLMLRDNLTRVQAEARLASQMPTEKKAALADHVILNTGTEEDLKESVSGLYRTFL